MLALTCDITLYNVYLFNDQDQNERFPSTGHLQKNRHWELIVTDRDTVTDVTAIAAIHGYTIAVVHDVDQHDVVATNTIAVVTTRERHRCGLSVFGKRQFFGIVTGNAESGNLRQSQDRNKDARTGGGHDKRHWRFVLRQVTTIYRDTELMAQRLLYPSSEGKVGGHILNLQT